MSAARDDLIRFDILADLPPDDLDALAAPARLRHLRDGDALFVASEPARSMFAVSRGRIVLRADVGDRPTIVMSAGAGELLGWSALRDDATWLTTGRAAGEADVLELPADSVLALLASGSPAARVLTRRLFGLAAEHLAETQRQLLRRGHEGPITGG
jgi:CRP-like cAMP-binding protein